MEQAWVSEERGWRLRWGGKWAERSLQEGIRELGRGRGRQLQANARVWGAGREGEHLGRATHRSV